nr:hypothetical protein [Tanacetum cinerariifolium]
MKSLNFNSQERVASVATNATQSKGKLHDIFSATSFSSTEKLFAKYTRIKVKQFRETLLLHMGNVKKSVAERTRHKRQYDRRIKERQMQPRESKVVDADIKPINDQVPSTEVETHGRIFKTVGLRWIPTGKLFASSTTKVDSKPPRGFNADITNLHEWMQILDMSAGTLKLDAGLVQNSVSPTPYVPPSKKEYEIMFQPLFDEYFNPPPRVVSLVLAAVVAPRAIDPAGLPSSTTIDQDISSASTSPTI